MPGNINDFSINKNENIEDFKQDDNYMDKKFGRPGVPPDNGGNDNFGNGKDIFK